MVIVASLVDFMRFIQDRSQQPTEPVFNTSFNATGAGPTTQRSMTAVERSIFVQGVLKFSGKYGMQIMLLRELIGYFCMQYQKK